MLLFTEETVLLKRRQLPQQIDLAAVCMVHCVLEQRRRRSPLTTLFVSLACGGEQAHQLVSLQVAIRLLQRLPERPPGVH